MLSTESILFCKIVKFCPHVSWKSAKRVRIKRGILMVHKILSIRQSLISWLINIGSYIAISTFHISRAGHMYTIENYWHPNIVSLTGTQCLPVLKKWCFFVPNGINQASVCCEMRNKYTLRIINRLLKFPLTDEWNIIKMYFNQSRIWI